jgi:predicted TIM-barrel fold metal-dependent hydrolase
MAGLGWDLPELGRLLDTYPNFYCDISDRLYEVGRQPYTGREFFLKYQDRILFGIDYIPEVDTYFSNYRILETYDEYVPYPRDYFRNVHWRVHGIGLPDAVLRKIYQTNAERLLAAPTGDSAHAE